MVIILKKTYYIIQNLNNCFKIAIDMKKNILIKLQLLIDFGMNIKDELFTITTTKVLETIIKYSHRKITLQCRL